MTEISREDVDRGFVVNEMLPMMEHIAAQAPEQPIQCDWCTNPTLKVARDHCEAELCPFKPRVDPAVVELRDAMIEAGAGDPQTAGLDEWRSVFYADLEENLQDPELADVYQLAVDEIKAGQ